MGSIFSSIWEKLFGYKEYKICIVGLNNAGKTTILYQFHLGEVVNSQPTLGSNVEEVIYRNIRFCMWDIGGQDNLRKTWSTYYSNTNAVILVVDSTDVDRLPIVKEELFKMLAHQDIQKAFLLIFVNKQDLASHLSPGDIAVHLSLSSLKDYHIVWNIQDCSALTGFGLYEGLDWITDHLLNQ